VNVRRNAEGEETVSWFDDGNGFPHHLRCGRTTERAPVGKAEPRPTAEPAKRLSQSPGSTVDIQVLPLRSVRRRHKRVHLTGWLAR
jgi:hypothetical protein